MVRMPQPLKNDSLDLITCAFGFRNLADYDRGLAEFLRVLKPGGVAAILEFHVPTSPKCAEQVKGLIKGETSEPLFFMIDEPEPGFRSYDQEAVAQPTTPISSHQCRKARR